jgi:hypothetical protein
MKDIYNSRIWKALNPGIRVDLIPVVERVRMGGYLELPCEYDRSVIPWARRRSPSYPKQRKILLFCLKKIGLKWREWNDMVYTAWNESDLEKLWSGEISPGQFLGYPKCCEENFYRGAQDFVDGKEEFGPAQKFWMAQKKAVEDGTYNYDLDFVFHAPCRIECKATAEFARKVRKVLEENDPETAEYWQKRSEELRS